jgi:hypothetical protein
MAEAARLSDEPAEQAIVHRLFQASLEVHSAMSIARDERVLELLHQTVALLDRSIKQVQSGMLAQSQCSCSPGTADDRLEQVVIRAELRSGLA